MCNQSSVAAHSDSLTSHEMLLTLKIRSAAELTFCRIPTKLIIRVIDCRHRILMCEDALCTGTRCGIVTPRAEYLHHRDQDFCPLLQIICTTLFLHDIEHRLGTEPAGFWRSNSPICECCILVIDLYSFVTPTPSGRVCHQLRLAALVEAHEPEDCTLNGFADSQDAVILEKSGLFVSQSVRNVFAFFVG